MLNIRQENAKHDPKKPKQKVKTKKNVDKKKNFAVKPNGKKKPAPDATKNNEEKQSDAKRKQAIVTATTSPTRKSHLDRKTSGSLRWRIPKIVMEDEDSARKELQESMKVKGKRKREDFKAKGTAVADVVGLYCNDCEVYVTNNTAMDKHVKSIDHAYMLMRTHFKGQLRHFHKSIKSVAKDHNSYECKVCDKVFFGNRNFLEHLGHNIHLQNAAANTETHQAYILHQPSEIQDIVDEITNDYLIGLEHILFVTKPVLEWPPHMECLACKSGFRPIDLPNHVCTTHHRTNIIEFFYPEYFVKLKEAMFTPEAARDLAKQIEEKHGRQKLKLKIVMDTLDSILERGRSGEFYTYEKYRKNALYRGSTPERSVIFALREVSTNKHRKRKRDKQVDRDDWSETAHRGDGWPTPDPSSDAMRGIDGWPSQHPLSSAGAVRGTDGLSFQNASPSLEAACGVDDRPSLQLHELMYGRSSDQPLGDEKIKRQKIQEKRNEPLQRGGGRGRVQRGAVAGFRGGERGVAAVPNPARWTG
ncbi:PREDICTED: uncharacterized protein LOC106810181 [Priapulus caudatus]|uniref:Uncharacterized protein LOC106810181 n=1 Tax=Priapulus caudatus TaxID=37621 RepID=A0ABM1E9S8_PRICU|nr:PREDICTED: uncharacterized protein LOC106810181 [Priapulus caudatus]